MWEWGPARGAGTGHIPVCSRVSQPDPDLWLHLAVPPAALSVLRAFSCAAGNSVSELPPPGCPPSCRPGGGQDVVPCPPVEPSHAVSTHAHQPYMAS